MGLFYLSLHIISVRGYALLFVFFLQKKRFDIQKKLSLSKMAKFRGDARSPRLKKIPPKNGYVRRLGH
jgi:hypothetical protein